MSSNTSTPPPPSINQPVESRLECPLCMFVLPLEAEDSIYKECCGKTICHGCSIAAKRARIMKPNPKSDNSSEWEKLLQVQMTQPAPCAFCRARPLGREEDEELVKRLRIGVETRQDTMAMLQLGTYHEIGLMMLPKSRINALLMYKRAYDLGCPEAAYALAQMYHGPHHKADPEKAYNYTQEAARRGHVFAEHNLGVIENRAKKPMQAAKHFMVAARAGIDESINALMEYYKKGLFSKDDLNSTLRAYQAAKDEVKTDKREYAKQFREF